VTETVDLTSFGVDRWSQVNSNLAMRRFARFPSKHTTDVECRRSSVAPGGRRRRSIACQFKAVANAKARLVDRGESNCTVTTIPPAVFHIISSTGPPATVRTSA